MPTTYDATLPLTQMAIEIEQPFGTDSNDLPLERYVLEVERQVFLLSWHGSDRSVSVR